MKKFQCMSCGKEAHEFFLVDYHIECSDEGCGFHWTYSGDGLAMQYRTIRWPNEVRWSNVPRGTLLIAASEKL
jgi:hypothetical protein